MKPSPVSPDQNPCRAEVVDGLRRLLPKLESVASEHPVFSFGLSSVDAHLPRRGLATGALHEVTFATRDDFPAAFGFATALADLLPRDGPMLLVLSPRLLANESGHPHGHGLNGLGLDPARLILVEPGEERLALWAMEEALRSGVPAAVLGAVAGKLDLRTSRRLHLAAANAGLPLILLLPAAMVEASAAATRWRIGGASAARDRFGLLARWRWRASLERCRNGRQGEWMLEFDHAAHRFSLAAPLADHALPGGADTRLAAGADRL